MAGVVAAVDVVLREDFEDVDDMEWHLTTRGLVGDEVDQSLLPDDDEEVDSMPAEQDL